MLCYPIGLILLRGFRTWPWASLLGVKAGVQGSAWKGAITPNLPPPACACFDSLTVRHTGCSAVEVGGERRWRRPGQGMEYGGPEAQQYHCV